MNELEKILKEYERTLFAICKDEDSGELSIEEACECRIQARAEVMEKISRWRQGVEVL